MQNSSENPKVSVIIPNFNRADLISNTIHNILGQSFRAVEIIVVDDGSTDHSIEVLEGFGTQITLIRQENSGPGGARNAGFGAASGQFIQFMDSDDLASLNKLEIQVAALESEGADMAFCPWFHIEWGISKSEGSLSGQS